MRTSVIPNSSNKKIIDENDNAMVTFPKSSGTKSQAKITWDVRPMNFEVIVRAPVQNIPEKRDFLRLSFNLN